MAPAMPPTLSVGGWPTSTEAGWMNASPWTSSVTTSAASRVSSDATTTSATQSAFSTTVSYSNGTTRSLASCAASLNGTVPSSPGFNFSGTIRRYYVAAEEIEWDYAPTGWDNWLGVGSDDLCTSYLLLMLANRYLSMTQAERETLATCNMALSGPRLCTEVTPMPHSLSEPSNPNIRVPKVCDDITPPVQHI
jgi:hypothetical protein